MRVVNIFSGSSDVIEATLSNFACTPFVLDGERIASVEGFHQGIKYEELSRRRRIFGLWGRRAKSAGRAANNRGHPRAFWGEGDTLRRIAWDSDEWRELRLRALLAKFTQNPEARSALLSTGHARFSHVLPDGKGRDLVEFQEDHTCRSLYQIREILRDDDG